MGCLEWIIIIFIIGVILMLIGIILFSPVVNSIITMILLGAVSYYVGNSYLYLYFAIICIDCIRDVVLTHKFYDYDISEPYFDVFYVVKSLLSIVTLGAARIIYLVIVYPIIAYKVKKSVEGWVNGTTPIPKSSPYSYKKQAFTYYYNKYLSKAKAEGLLTDNCQTVDKEIAASKKKLDKLYPKKLVEKIADTVAGSKEVKEARKNAEKRIDARERYYAYLPVEKYKVLPDKIKNAMSDKGTLSASEILKFDELKDTFASSESADDKTRWEYFVIQTLEPLVSDGSFEDNDFNDNDPLDNHAYHYVNSTKSMPSIDADNNPLLALDDD